jgi:hypothetical protein
MKKRTLSIVLAMILSLCVWGLPNASGQHGDHGKMEHGTPSGHEKMGHGNTEKTFTHEAVVDGIKAAFQVMSLAEMNMKDPKGNTHHVMAKFFDKATKDQIKDAIGKIKVIAPSGKEQVASLQDYSGIFAANFTVAETGKHGIICLFKIHDKKHLVKFWYNPE